MLVDFKRNNTMHKEIYNCQRQDGGLELIKKLARQVHRSPIDTHEHQSTALAYFVSHSSAAKEFFSFSKEALQDYQLSRLKVLADNAFSLVPAYREIYKGAGYELGGISTLEDFKKLPIMSKKILSAFDPSERVVDPAYMSKAFTARTSGSSGARFTVYRHHDYSPEDHLQFLRFYNSCLTSPLKEDDWVYLLHHAPLPFSSLLGKYRVFQLPDLLPETPLGEHLRYLKPRLMVVLPSYFPLILMHRDALLASGVEAILTNSESSTRAERDYYSKAIGVPIFDEYSSEEIGFIATQCVEGKYHVTEDSAYVEVINQDSQGFGSVICTDLMNMYMPMIRFDHGDIAHASERQQQCACGSHFSTLNEVNGRRDDAFRTREHTLVPSASILGALDEILLDGDQTLASFRIIQKSADTILLLTHYVGLPCKSMADTLRELNARLSKLFGYPVILIHEEVVRLPENNSYKRKSIVREWELN